MSSLTFLSLHLIYLYIENMVPEYMYSYILFFLAGIPKFILISVHDYNLPPFLLSSGYFTGKRKAESEVLSKYPYSGILEYSFSQFLVYFHRSFKIHFMHIEAISLFFLDIPFLSFWYIFTEALRFVSCI